MTRNPFYIQASISLTSLVCSFNCAAGLPNDSQDSPIQRSSYFNLLLVGLLDRLHHLRQHSLLPPFLGYEEGEDGLVPGAAEISQPAPLRERERWVRSEFSTMGLDFPERFQSQETLRMIESK